MSTSKFLAGAVIGLVAGLLLAPEKGEDLRNELADTAENIKKKLYRIAGKTGAELTDLRDMLENEVSGLSDDVRYRILTILEESGQSANNIKKTVSSELG